MNDRIKFLAQQRTSYLAGKAIEAILDGNHSGAQELLQMEIESIKLHPPIADLKPKEQVSANRIDCNHLDNAAKVCFGCIKKDMPDLPADFAFTSTSKGQCESCGEHDLLLTTMIKVRSSQDQAIAPDTEADLPFMLQKAH